MFALTPSNDAMDALPQAGSAIITLFIIALIGKNDSRASYAENANNLQMLFRSICAKAVGEKRSRGKGLVFVTYLTDFLYSASIGYIFLKHESQYPDSGCFEHRKWTTSLHRSQTLKFLSGVESMAIIA